MGTIPGPGFDSPQLHQNRKRRLVAAAALDHRQGERILPFFADSSIHYQVSFSYFDICFFNMNFTKY